MRILLFALHNSKPRRHTKREVKQLKKFLFITAILAVILFTNAVVFAAPGDKLLKQGMRGDEIQVLQKMLTDAGVYSGDIDGVFGNTTFRAVQDFQRIHGLAVDGVVGKQTWTYLERAGAEPSRYSRTLVVTASAYTAYDDGNSNRTSRGNPVHKGIVAVDPNTIPLGTRLYIPGYGYAIADDVGGAINGNRIDLAFDSRGQALEFGVQRVTVYILD